MINIKKVKKENPKENIPRISLRPIHNELALISNKFIGITAKNNVIRDIVVEEGISENKITQLKSKLNELMR